MADTNNPLTTPQDIAAAGERIYADRHKQTLEKEHPGQFAADVSWPVPVDDAGDPAHVVGPSRYPVLPRCRDGRYGRMSRYSLMSQSETVAQ